MSASVTPREPELIGAAPPPVSRDPMVITWLAAGGISLFGDFAWTVALAWTAAHTLSPGLAGVVLGAAMVPQALLVLLGGILADRHNPRVLLVSGQVGQAVVLLVGAAVWSSGHHGAPVLIVIAVCFGIAAGLTLPAEATLVRQLISNDDMATVQGWSQIINRAARLLGAPIGGILVAWRGLVAVMLVDAVSFLLIALVLVLVVRPRFRVPRSPHERWRDSFGDGMAYLRGDRVARLFVVGVTALNVFVTPVAGLGVALRVSGSHWGAGWLGIADACLAAGAILGSIVGIRKRPEHGAAAAFGMLVVQGVAIACVGIGWRPALILAMGLLGFTAGAASVWLGAAFLKVIEPSHLGRVSSVTSLGDMTLMPLSVPALGIVAAHTSVLTATVAFGSTMSLLCLWFGTRPEIRALRV